MKRAIVIIFFLVLQVNVCFSYELTIAQKKAIGMQIWQNEAGQKYELLAFWNKNERFPSLGICHFIWYPAGLKEIYTQTFPELLDYFKKMGIVLPDWLEKAHKEGGAPWKNKQQFEDPHNKAQLNDLRKLLYETMDLQIDFVVKRVHHAWQRIYNNVQVDKRPVIKRHYERLRQTQQGMYALIDYLNFKGEGTSPKERYNKKGWGLLQVLEAMPENIKSGNEAQEFAKAAKAVLQERVRFAPPHKLHEQKWLAGWHKRIDTYLKPLS